ncbi:MAG: GntR family transcriptional regulator [Synechococcaceae cyanobacterium SM2_3_60]|nr:GntR family transcriptional regulator [Synechococcaceae cyanobacterium SM2_3_60]
MYLRPVPRKGSLYEQTYQALREVVLSGELVPGSRLIETELAKQLQVSRTPIREALRQLQREELLVVGASGGLQVPLFTEQDAAYLYDCRLALEQMAVRGACEHATDSDLAELKMLVSNAEQAVGAAQPQHLLDLDYRFHHTIAASTRNSWLVSLLDHVFDKMVLIRRQTTQANPGVLEIRVEHRDIYDAIAKREPEIALMALGEHISASKRRVIQQLRELQQHSARGR